MPEIEFVFQQKGLGGWHFGTIPQRQGREIGDGSVGCLEMGMVCFGVLCFRPASLRCLDRYVGNFFVKNLICYFSFFL